MSGNAIQEMLPNRIEKPLELAKYLLAGNPAWPRQSLLAAIDRGVEKTVALPEPIAVHLVYLTAWVDGESILHYRRDAYQRDDAIEKALAKLPPTAREKTDAGN